MKLTIPAIVVAFAAALPADSVPWRDLTAAEKIDVERAVPATAPAEPKHPRKVLLVHMTKRNGKPVGGHPSIPFGNHALAVAGSRTGAFTLTVGNDESVFRRESLRHYDAVVFNNTTGVLFDDPVLRQSLIDFVRNGKGFVGFHAAGATFVQWPVYDQFPAYGAMLGGYEDGGHPWGPDDVTHVLVEDPASPLTSMFDGPFTIREETFQFREPALRERLHVLLRIDTSKMDTTRRILPQRRKDMDFPVSWIKSYGSGRVFYTTMGHSPESFTNPVLLKHFLAGIQFALGDLAADATPSAKVGR